MPRQNEHSKQTQDALAEEFKPYYKRRQFWWMAGLFLFSAFLGAGLAVAIPFMAPGLVMGLVTTLLGIAGAAGGWGIIAAVGAVAGLFLMVLAYEGIQFLKKRLSNKVQPEEPVCAKREVKGTDEANEIAKEMTEIGIKIKALRDNSLSTEESEEEKALRTEESELRQKALATPCQNAAEKAGFYYAALGVTSSVLETKAVDETDYKKAFREVSLRWHPDKYTGDAKGEEFKRIGDVKADLENPQSELWQYQGPSRRGLAEVREGLQQFDERSKQVDKHIEEHGRNLAAYIADSDQLADEIHQTTKEAHQVKKEAHQAEEEARKALARAEKAERNVAEVAQKVQQHTAEWERVKPQMQEQLDFLFKTLGVSPEMLQQQYLASLSSNTTGNQTATQHLMVNSAPVVGNPNLPNNTASASTQLSTEDHDGYFSDLSSLNSSRKSSFS